MADKVTAARPAPARGMVAIAGLLAVLVALWVVPLLFAPQIGDEAFPGADAQAVEMLEETGYEPWITPIFEPSGEVESGIFALQAAIGAGVLFYAIGHLHGRSRGRRALRPGGTGPTDEPSAV